MATRSDEARWRVRLWQIAWRDCQVPEAQFADAELRLGKQYERLARGFTRYAIDNAGWIDCADRDSIPNMPRNMA